MASTAVISKKQRAQLRELGQQEPRLAALYAFGLRRKGELDLAALYVERLAWPERLDLELAIGRELELENVELTNLRRMPLAFRYWIINHGLPLYVGHPEVLAAFIEETIGRYTAFYPLLEALYWKAESKPRPDDML
jgi:hypothetical protein